MRGLIIVITAIAVLSLAAAGFAAYRLQQQFDLPGPQVEMTRIRVAPGQSLRTVLQTLHAAGIIEHPRALELWCRLRGDTESFKVGNYDIPARASPRAVLEQLRAGRVVLETLTIIEGWSFAQMRAAIARHPKIRHTLKGATDAELMKTLGHAGEHPEGRFFPDTYRFADGTTDREILGLAYSQMAELLAKSWAARDPAAPLQSPYEALILASIVEKESALHTERPIIAGVYTSRLKIGMRLQSDPTVIYGLGEAYDGDIRTRDLRADTPYNTYTRAGLPPTPIALPGAGSVVAATRPNETGALFFVATGRPDGSHVFSKDYASHQRAVTRMLKLQRSAASQR